MKIPIEIQKVKYKDAQFKVVVSLQDALARISLDKEFIKIQTEYDVFIKKCKKILENIQKNNKSRGDPLLKWRLADALYTFVKGLEERGFVFANLTEALSRDLNMSVSQLNYLIEFRTTYPHLGLINKNISWDKYKELLDISTLLFRKECEKKILSRELKTREDIRLFKKQQNHP